MSYSDQSYIGSGKFHMRERGTTDPLVEIGNVSAASFGIESESQSLRNYRGGGGEANKLERITAVNMSLTLHDFNSENLSLVLYGSTSTDTASSVASEVQPGADSGLIRTDKLIDTTQTVTVTGPSASPTHTEGTDYNITAAGIEVIDGGAIALGADIEVTYESLGVEIVDALMNSGKEYELYIDGVNDAQSGAPFVIDVWRFKPSPAQDIGVISDDFASFSISGSVLIDTTKTTTSQYFRRISKAS